MQKRLPELLTNHELVGFYETVWHACNPTHMVMIKLPIYTGSRNAKLARVRRQDAYLDHCQLCVVQGKSRDRKTGLSASVSAIITFLTRKGIISQNWLASASAHLNFTDARCNSSRKVESEKC
jgi:hypothetical protein